jgi:hypothetical protein
MAAEALPQADVKLFGKWSFDDVEVSRIGRDRRSETPPRGGRRRVWFFLPSPPLCPEQTPSSPRFSRFGCSGRRARAGQRVLPHAHLFSALQSYRAARPGVSITFTQLSPPPPSLSSCLSSSPKTTPQNAPAGQRHRAGGLHRRQAQVRGVRAPHRGPLPAPPLPQGAVPDRRAVSVSLLRPPAAPSLPPPLPRSLSLLAIRSPLSPSSPFQPPSHAPPQPKHNTNKHQQQTTK